MNEISERKEQLGIHSLKWELGREILIVFVVSGTFGGTVKMPFIHASLLHLGTIEFNV